MEMLQNVIGWEFLDEPLTRWFLFLGALTAMLTAWAGIINLMKT